MKPSERIKELADSHLLKYAKQGGAVDDSFPGGVNKLRSCVEALVDYLDEEHEKANKQEGE